MILGFASKSFSSKFFYFGGDVALFSSPLTSANGSNSFIFLRLKLSTDWFTTLNVGGDPPGLFKVIYRNKEAVESSTLLGGSFLKVIRRRE